MTGSTKLCRSTKSNTSGSHDSHVPRLSTVGLHEQPTGLHGRRVYWLLVQEVKHVFTDATRKIHSVPWYNAGASWVALVKTPICAWIREVAWFRMIPSDRHGGQCRPGGMDGFIRQGELDVKLAWMASAHVHFTIKCIKPLQYSALVHRPMISRGEYLVTFERWLMHWRAQRRQNTKVMPLHR